MIVPANLEDESGRKLENAARFPLAVEIDKAPPLIKFAAPFGILEAREGGVLPLTVRAVEPALERRVKAITVRHRKTKKCHPSRTSREKREHNAPSLAKPR